MGGAGSEGDNDARFYNFDLSFEEGEGAGHFLGGGWAIVGGLVFGGGAEFANIGEIDLLAGEAHGFEDLVEFVAGWADEGFLLLLVVEAGGLADEHELGLWVAGGEDEGLAEALKVFKCGPSLGDGGEGVYFFGWGAAAGADGGLCAGGGAWAGWGFLSSFGGVGGVGGGAGAAGAPSGVEFSEDLAGLVCDGDVADALLAELLQVVDEGWRVHGGRRP